MLHTDESDELKAKHICCACVGEPYLSQEIKKTGEEALCSYCDQTAPSWSIKQLTDRIHTAFDHHYTRTSNAPDSFQERLLADRESRYDWERDGVPVLEAIENAADISSEVAADVLALLDDQYDDFDAAAMGEETEFSSDTYYTEKGPNSQAWHEEWRTFEESLKTEARYFSRSAAAHLASIFGAIDKLKTSNGRPLVAKAGPKSALNHLYRARVFQADGKLEEALGRPDLDLGSPPAKLASAGRMNARGISVFYGATAARAAIAEVRPPVGSKVAVAKFSIIRPLRLLDLTALEKVQDGGSIFDVTLKDRLERVAFLRSLGQLMTRAVMPDDEVFDYLATQAIADFLATENEPALDGIIFRSVQVKGGRNVALFHKAARVEEIKLPEGTEITAYSGHGTEDGWEVDYWVSENVPPAPASPSKADGLQGPSLGLFPAYDWQGDSRDVTLRIDPQTVEVHHVDWVSYRSTTHKVARHRFEKPGLLKTVPVKPVSADDF